MTTQITIAFRAGAGSSATAAWAKNDTVAVPGIGVMYSNLLTTTGLSSGVSVSSNAAFSGSGGSTGYATAGTTTWPEDVFERHAFILSNLSRTLTFGGLPINTSVTIEIAGHRGASANRDLYFTWGGNSSFYDQSGVTTPTEPASVTGMTDSSGNISLIIESTTTADTAYVNGIKLTYESAPLPAVTSINTGNPITASQSTVSSITTAFTGLPTSITCNLPGITCTSISGSTNAPTFVKSQRINGQPWPLNGSIATFTFTKSAETASSTQLITKDANEVVYTFNGVITDDQSSVAYHLAADGFMVEGGEHTYVPYGNLLLTEDGGGTVSTPGSFTSWFRPANGTGAGNVYFYNWTIDEFGKITISLLTLVVNSTSPKYDGLYPNGDRP